MAKYLVTLSLGPVQSLIGAARRTRDLWCGSWLLNEAAKAAAKVINDQHKGALIFPCPDSETVTTMPISPTSCVPKSNWVAMMRRGN